MWAVVIRGCTAFPYTLQRISQTGGDEGAAGVAGMVGTRRVADALLECTRTHSSPHARQAMLTHHVYAAQAPDASRASEQQLMSGGRGSEQGGGGLGGGVSAAEFEKGVQAAVRQQQQKERQQQPGLVFLVASCNALQVCCGFQTFVLHATR